MANAQLESSNGQSKDECLNIHLFFTQEDAEEKLERWRQNYNKNRPYRPLGGIPPS